MEAVFEAIMNEKQDKMIITKLASARCFEADHLVFLSSNYLGKALSAKASSKASKYGRRNLTSQNKEEQSH